MRYLVFVCRLKILQKNTDMVMVRVLEDDKHPANHFGRGCGLFAEKDLPKHARLFLYAGVKKLVHEHRKENSCYTLTFGKYD